MAELLKNYVKKPTVYNILDFSQFADHREAHQHLNEMWGEGALVSVYDGADKYLVVLNGRLLEIPKDGRIAFIGNSPSTITMDIDDLVPYEELYGPRE